MKILIVDDDAQTLDALTVGIQLQWSDCSVLTATNAGDGSMLFVEQDPDVVVLDVMLPDRSGFDLLREIRQVSDVPVIMLTARGEEMEQVRGLELGADDYVVKPFSHLALTARIKAVLRRAELPPPERALPDFEAGDLAVKFQNHVVTKGGEPVRLTPVEYKLLYQLVRNAGRLLPHEALLNRVWGPDHGATANHLKVFVSRLRSKIESNGDGPHYIETERGIGYRFIRPKDIAGALAETTPSVNGHDAA